MFYKLLGAYPGNNQTLFYSGQDSHLDTNALNMMTNNSAYSYFLKFGDSINDQPKDNGFNTQAKHVYSDEKLAWDKVFVTTPCMLAHMNTVIVEM